MSGPSPTGPMGPTRRESTGPPSAGGPMATQQSSAPPTPSAGSGTGSQQNLNQIVIEYLNKKGYNKTEAMLRQESASVDAGRSSLPTRAEDRGGYKFLIAYSLLFHFVEDNLELYKAELRRLLWPVFVYSFLGIVLDNCPDLSKTFYDENAKQFSKERSDDLRALQPVRHPDHVDANATAKTYRDNKYRLTLTNAAYYSLIQFLESKEKEGGSVINGILQRHMHIITIDRASGGPDRAFATILAKLSHGGDIPDEDEGIPGHNPGSHNTDRNAPAVLTKVSLGALPMDEDLQADIRDDLEEEDSKNPPEAGQNSLVDELEQKIKREPSEDPPARDNVPLPRPLARDVAMEVQKIKEHRDRFKIEPRSSGVGPGISVTMYTFHNTFDSVNCIDFSGDNALVAAGTSESYIRVWSLEGKPLTSINQDAKGQENGHVKPQASRRLVGHSGPVYAVSFSPSIASTDPASTDLTKPRYLLSCSADKTVRLWSLDTWSALVVYKGHTQPVWDITWGPFGHYFATGSHDRTARLWSTDHISPLRIYAGHDADVDTVAFHPNNAYLFTGSSDKTVRMWDVQRGSPVRIFTGHTANVTSIACAPNGRTLASADDAGAIILWDLASGRRLKRMRGHGRGGVWSLDWSVESSLLVSGGADNTLRVWDVLQQTDGAVSSVKATDATTATSASAGAGSGTSASAGSGNSALNADKKAEGSSAAGGGTSGASASATTTVSSAVAKKGKGRDVAVTADQISAFPTKKSPVYKVRFTNMNLVLAGGAYLP